MAQHADQKRNKLKVSLHVNVTRQIVDWINSVSHGIAWTMPREACTVEERDASHLQPDVVGIWDGRPLAICILNSSAESTRYREQLKVLLRRAKARGGIAISVLSLYQLQEELKDYEPSTLSQHVH